MAELFQHLDAEANRSLQLATDEAKDLGHDWLGPAHVLIGLLRSGDETLASIGLTADAVRAELVRAVGSGDASDGLAINPALQFILGVAIGRAGGERASRRHLLLSIVEHDHSLADSILRSVGADPEAIRRRLA
jgi:ATP-dependent Clp protease ATP-binding subunit ClpC